MQDSAPPGQSDGLREPVGTNTVHLWRLDLDAPAAAAWQVLAPDETARAARLQRAHDRDRWVAARAGLRRVLGSYLGRHGATLRFRYGPQGKPSLVLSRGALDLRFNLSHSGAVALIAVAVGCEVGVDVEALRAGRNFERLARRVFSPPEQHAWAALPAEQRLAAFYRGWTRKEAYVKARGEGLWQALRSFDVTLGAGEPARLLGTRPDAGEAGRWTLWDIEAGTGYVAALAVEGLGRELIVRSGQPTDEV